MQTLTVCCDTRQAAPPLPPNPTSTVKTLNPTEETSVLPHCPCLAKVTHVIPNCLSQQKKHSKTATQSHKSQAIYSTVSYFIYIKLMSRVKQHRYSFTTLLNFRDTKISFLLKINTHLTSRSLTILRA